MDYNLFVSIRGGTGLALAEDFTLDSALYGYKIHNNYINKQTFLTY